MPHQQFQSCIDACYACAITCDHCAAACINEADPKQLARCIQLDLDCAAACRLASAYMGRGSELSMQMCEFCAQVCDACAEECERHQQMQHCEECARACRRCADECRRMGAQGTEPRAGQAASASH